jgi:hypothetical protein
MDKLPVAHFEVPREMHDRVLLLQDERQKVNPHRRVTLAEVWREVVGAGLVALGPDREVRE